MSTTTTSTSTPTMKTWQYPKFGPKIEENMFLNNAAPRIGHSLAPDEILVQVISCSINPVDYKLAEATISRVAIALPATPGCDYCGRVIHSGNAIDSLAAGQLVFGKVERPMQFGTLGEYIIVTLNGCVPVPAGVSPDEASTIGTAGLTAYQCIKPNVQAGSKVFINGGSGGTGVYGIQIAKILGCHVTTSCSTGNIALCKDLGADEVIDYKVSDISEKLKAEGLVYDLVVDNVGSPANLYLESSHFLKESGKFVQVAMAFEWKSIGSLFSRMLKPRFLGGGTRKYQFLGVSPDADGLVEIAKWVSEGKVKVLIDSTYEYVDAIKAFEKLKTGRSKGKIVVHVTHE